MCAPCAWNSLPLAVANVRYEAQDRIDSFMKGMAHAHAYMVPGGLFVTSYRTSIIPGTSTYTELCVTFVSTMRFWHDINV